MTPQENFGAWLDAHYVMFDEAGRPRPVCRRCGLPVAYVTKHAAVRHGDAIEVMPVRNRGRSLAESY